MINISLAGLLGAILGTVVAALLYGPLVASVERAFALRRPSDAPGERITAQEASMLRRAVLATDIVVFGGLGYWLGETIGG